MSKQTAKPKQCRSCTATINEKRNYCAACRRRNRKGFVQRTCADCGVTITKESIRCQPCNYKAKTSQPEKFCSCGVKIAPVSARCRKCFNIERKEKFIASGRIHVAPKLPPPVAIEKPMFEWLEIQNPRLARMFGRLNAQQQKLAAKSIAITRRRFEKQDVSDCFWESVREIIEDAKQNVYFCLDLEAERGNLPPVEIRRNSPLAAVITNG